LHITNKKIKQKKNLVPVGTTGLTKSDLIHQIMSLNKKDIYNIDSCREISVRYSIPLKSICQH